MNMKSYRYISAAILAALGLYPPWAGVQNCNAQTNTNLYRARINLVCTTTNADGNLEQDRIITSEFVRDAALSVGVTNLDELTLAYNPSSNSLEVVNRSTREVVATPLSFGGGTSVANLDNTRVVLQNFVFLNSETVANGLLSATQRLAYADSGELRSFGMRGTIYYSFANDTNSPTACEGILAVGSGISKRGNGNQDSDDDDDENNSLPGRGNNGNQGNGSSENNLSTNVVNPELGTTNVNPGFSITNIFPGLGTTNGFGITNVTPGFGTTNINPGFGTTNINPGFSITNVFPGFGTTNVPVIPGLGITNVPAIPGFGTTNINPGFGTTNVIPAIPPIPGFGTTNVNPVNQGIGNNGSQ